MNKNILTILLTVATGLLISCGNDDSQDPPSVLGTWHIIEQSLTSNYPEYDKNANNLFKEDHKNYYLKREIAQVEPGVGSIKTTATAKNSTSEVPERNRLDTYTITKDTMYVSDQRLGMTKYTMRLDYEVFITYMEVTKYELDRIITEIGGEKALIPDNIVGKIKMVERR